ncbi:DUF4082 domain-containing protein [Streptosporangium sp. NPDC049304]|uniref:DUF4082 domain-containing protein n=1 Tax=Streptosporangium sp. NPDC049304 TaxID=3154830 RepID=UPI00341771F0
MSGGPADVKKARRWSQPPSPVVLGAGLLVLIGLLGAGWAPVPDIGASREGDTAWDVEFQRREDGGVPAGPDVTPSPVTGIEAERPAPVPGAAAGPERTRPAGHRAAEIEAPPPPDARRGRALERRLARLGLRGHPVEGAGEGKSRSRSLHADCPLTSVICLENSLPGNPSSEWDIPGAGSSNIQGYATQMSVDKGETVQFKVDTTATAYHVDVYRIGYYGGMGARKITTLTPSVPLPQAQPPCLTDAVTALVDCGTWAVSASWAVPADAVSGVYIANLIRDDATPGASQMIFVIRDDERGSDLLLQTSDSTWQAYNKYGGSSLYSASVPAGRAYKVSYNRPFITRVSSCCGGSVESWFFNAEYPMIRWIEANGYDVSYTSSIDTAMRGQQILNHRVFLSVGHDEYWSDDMRDNVTNARDNGVNITFFSGNEGFWKGRWEQALSDGTPFRTFVCYKETLANAKIDPSPQWTGSWRDPRFSPPSNGGRPENALNGTWFRVNGVSNDAITVPADFSKMRIWRNTSVANLSPGQTAVFPTGTLGYEWDVSPSNGSEPPGVARYSSTIMNLVSKYLLDYGSTYGLGTANHNLTLYRASSGALVFGAGTVQWSWGLDANHDRAGPPADIRMQQATVNLLADMHSQPASLQPGLVPATASTDTSPPTSTITSPSNGVTLPELTTVVIKGTAADTGGGVVAGIEVSIDGGNRWFPATGRENWQYRWTPQTTGTTTIAVRAVDDIGNLQVIPTTITVTVNTSCNACTIWPPSAVPAVNSANDPVPVELGVQFQTTTAGIIRGVRFYKGVLNTGTHTGNLWSASGQLLARATFTGETGSGWQQVDFDTPVAVTAGTTYVASYHTTSGNYSTTVPYFTTQYTNGPFVVPASSVQIGNGVYTYSATSTFPTRTYRASNYWVDVLFVPVRSLWDDQTVPQVPSQNDPKAVTVGVKFQALTDGNIEGIRFYKGAKNTGTHVGALWTSDGQLLASATFTNETASGWQQVRFGTPVAVTAHATYIASYFTSSGFYSLTSSYFTQPYTNGPLVALGNGDEGGNGVYTYGATSTFPTSTYQASNYWVDVLFVPFTSLWEKTATPAVTSHPDNQPVTVGVKFQAMTSGSIRGVRFYKGVKNTGAHVGSLWTSDGKLLASATFTNETASGWQQVNFNTPVPVTENTKYVVSYNTLSGNYSLTRPYFNVQYTSEPLIAPASGAVGGNGVYTYGAANLFPVSTSQASNYWVDVVFAVD